MHEVETNQNILATQNSNKNLDSNPHRTILKKLP